MSFLLINLVVLAAVAGAAVFAYAQALHARETTDEWMPSAPTVDYAALQAHWRGEAAARDWESLKAQVGRWQAAGVAGDGAARCEEVARNLNRAVFRFAVPGEPLALGRVASAAPAAQPAAAVLPCPARSRARTRS